MEKMNLLEMFLGLDQTKTEAELKAEKEMREAAKKKEREEQAKKAEKTLAWVRSVLMAHDKKPTLSTYADIEYIKRHEYDCFFIVMKELGYAK